MARRRVFIVSVVRYGEEMSAAIVEQDENHRYIYNAALFIGKASRGDTYMAYSRHIYDLLGDNEEADVLTADPRATDKRSRGRFIRLKYHAYGNVKRSKTLAYLNAEAHQTRESTVKHIKITETGVASNADTFFTEQPNDLRR